MNIVDRLKHAWNAFNTTATFPPWSEPSVYSYRKRSTNPTTSAFASSIYNRIAIDVAMTTLRHVKENKENEDLTDIDSGLNYCLNVEANTDQTGVAFLHDIVYSMFDEGAVAIVPVETTINPKVSGSYDITAMRTGKILEFRTGHVKLKLYNEKSGRFEDIWLPKSMVAIVENPLYAVVNAPNSTLQRLLNKMSLVDNFDEVASSGRLDIFIQLPYAIKTERQQKMVKDRLNQIEDQLKTGNHGIGYLDGTEKVVQLNRPSQNNLLENVKLLTEQFYNQLGLTQKVFDGTASEAEMRNYYNRTIDPIIEFIIKEFERKFLTKTARTQGHKIDAYRNNFKLVPVEQIINLADTFRRNQVATSNEIRKLVGFKPSNDPLADQLSNPNIADANKDPGGGGLIRQPEPEEEPQMEEVE